MKEVAWRHHVHRAPAGPAPALAPDPTPGTPAAPLTLQAEAHAAQVCHLALILNEVDRVVCALLEVGFDL